MVTADDFERRHGRTRGGRAEKGSKGGMGGWLLGGVLLAAGAGVAATNEDVRDAVLGFGRTAPVSGDAQATGANENNGFYVADNGASYAMGGTSQEAIDARIWADQALRGQVVDRINTQLAGMHRMDRGIPSELSRFELQSLVIRRATPREVASGVPANIVNYEYAVEGRNDLGEGTGVDTGERRRGSYSDPYYTN